MLEFNNLDFTLHSEEDFYDTVDMSEFMDEDADSIYSHLNNKMKLIPFGDYLKRYIYRKAGFDEPFEEIDIREYQGIIIESFAENYTPKSFVPTSSKLSALAKNWLTQTAVSRQTVFLLGFGLKMTAEDVSKFLVHAQRERDFNFRNPFEIICWYCYKNGYKYPKFEQLLESYENLPTNTQVTSFDATISIRDWFQSIATEDGLMQKLSEIKNSYASLRFGKTEFIKDENALHFSREKDGEKLFDFVGDYLSPDGKEILLSGNGFMLYKER